MTTSDRHTPHTAPGPPDGLSRKRVEDLATLRALAHPLRMQLLGALRRSGPATASELGRRLGESSGSASYHLRQLARYGFVEEAPEQPSRRERVWRSVHELTAWDVDTFLDDPAGRAVVGVLERERLHGQVDALRRWYATRAGWPLPWVRAAQDSDAVLHLTADELAELSAELWQVVERRLSAQRALPGEAGTDRAPGGRQPVRVHVQAFPDPDR
ncbi:MAG TPA: helix-turn-helix domain-containing protein [Jiangellales bacterium]|nr:helix-turn-helix domain-containing protein [Jiangellales bacterium]